MVLGTSVTVIYTSPMESSPAVFVSVSVKLSSVTLLGGSRDGSRVVMPMKSSWKPQS